MVRIERRLPVDVWAAFVSGNPNSNVFHTPEMSEVFARTLRHTPRTWVAVDSDGSPLVLLLPVEVEILGGMARSWANRAILYGGMLRSPLSGRDALDAVFGAFHADVRSRTLFCELRHMSEIDDGDRRLLGDLGYTHERHLNYLVDLEQEEDELWKRLSRSTRQRVRSAAKKGVEILDVTNQDFDEAYELLANAYRNSQVPLADFSLFQAAQSVLAPKGMLKVFVAQMDGRTIGCRFLLIHKNRVLDWYAAADRSASTYSPNEALVWHTLVWGQDKGLGVFDFGGAGNPARPYGPREFKAKFGGQLVDFGRDLRIHSRTRFRTSQVVYGMARKVVWGRGHKG